MNRVECAHIRKDTEQIEFLSCMIEGIFIRSSTFFYMSAYRSSTYSYHILFSASERNQNSSVRTTHLSHVFLRSNLSSVDVLIVSTCDDVQTSCPLL